MVGIAEIDYTPEPGISLEGNYRGDDYASRGVHDPLFARAHVFQGTDGTKPAILSVDLCSLNQDGK